MQLKRWLNIEQYCADVTLDTNQRREILQIATALSYKVDMITATMNLSHAQS
jgi:hypothetical protein